MKFVALLLPALVASAAVLEVRQLGGTRSGKSTGKSVAKTPGSTGGSQGKFGTAKVAGTRKLTPVVNPQAQREITRFGPLTLNAKKAGAKDSGEQNWMLTIRDGICKNCTVLKGKVGIENIDGTPAGPKSGVYIHHILTYDTKKKGKSFVQGCVSGGGSTPSGMGAKFIGTGEDNNNIDVWYTSKTGGHLGGFHIGSADTFMMNADLVSYAEEKRQVYITLDTEYLRGIQGGDAREMLLSVTGCGNPSIKLSSTGPTSTKSGTFTFTEDGSLIGAKGHLHSGGDKMILYINGKVACESKALYGSKGDSAIESMSVCFEKPRAVKKGDQLVLEAVYDVSQHPVRKSSGSMPDIMGMFNVYFA